MSNEFKQRNGVYIPRNDIANNWRRATNFIPRRGEMIVYNADPEGTEYSGKVQIGDVEYDYSSSTSVRFKFGDGVQNVNALPFVTTGTASFLPSSGVTDSSLKITTEDVIVEKDNSTFCLNEETEIDLSAGNILLFHHGILFTDFEIYADSGIVDLHDYIVTDYAGELFTVMQVTGGVGTIVNTTSGLTHDGDGNLVIGNTSENIAYGTYGLVSGDGTTAGMRGFRIVSVDYDNTTKTACIQLNSVSGIAEGDVYSVRNSWNSYNRGIVTVVNDSSKVIYVTNWLNKDLASEETVAKYPWYNTITFESKPDIGDVYVGVSAHAEGKGTKALQAASHAEGWDNMSIGHFSHTEGQDNIAMFSAHAEGRQNKAIGEYSHAEGKGNLAGVTKFTDFELQYFGENSKDGCIVFSENNPLHLAFSKFIGKNVRFVSEDSGEVSPAYEITRVDTENVLYNFVYIKVPNGKDYYYDNKFDADYLYIEGAEQIGLTLIGHQSHVEGNETKALGNNSHAEGQLTTVTGASAHAEGYDTTAAGEAAHSEGYYTWALGAASHAQGNNTYAKGRCSFAAGEHTIASGNHQTVIGKFSSEDADKAFIIGGGEHDDQSRRKNIHTVDWEGNAYYEGNVTSKSTSTSTLTVDGMVVKKGTDGKFRIENNTYVHGSLNANASIQANNGDLITSKSVYANGGNVVAKTAVIAPKFAGNSASGMSTISIARNPTQVTGTATGEIRLESSITIADRSVNGGEDGAILNPSFNLEPSITASAKGCSYSIGTKSYNLGSSTNKWTTVYATNGVINTSSRDSKENIKAVVSASAPAVMSLTNDAEEVSDISVETIVDFVRSIDPVTFNYKNDNSQQALQLGLIADDIAEHLHITTYGSSVGDL